MGYYEKNIDCIKNKRSFMYNKLKDTDITLTSNRISSIYEVDTRESVTAIVVGRNKKEYRINSSYYPTEEAEKWASQYKSKNMNIMVSMFGLGNGTFARAILTNLGENHSLLIYEPSADLFYYVINHYDLTDILSDKRVIISVEKINDYEFHSNLRAVMNISNIGDLAMCVHPHYDVIFPESCILYWNELKESYFSARMNINTEIHFGRRFIENTLKNIKYISDSLSLPELKKYLPKDVPAIVVAAGPSVGKQIEELKRAKGRTVIFAVDRILEFLLDSGLEPDFVLTIDAMKPVKYFTQREDVTVPLICFQESNYEITERHKGKKIICNCTTFLEKIYTDAGKLPPKTLSSASVATLAFTVCVELGFKNIILVGQDLAYDGEQSHTGKEKEVYGTDRDVMLEDIHGNPIRSRYDWKEFVTWYEDALTLLPDINVIDAKEKGAKIKGTTVLPLKEALSQYCETEFDYNQLGFEKKNTFNQEDMQHIKNYLNKSFESLQSIQRKSKEAIKICDKLIRDSRYNDSGAFQTQIMRLTKINEYISKQRIYLLMDRYVIAVSAQSIMEMNRFTDDPTENSINTYEKSKSIFEAIVEAAAYIKPKLEEAIEQVIPRQVIEGNKEAFIHK